MTISSTVSHCYPFVVGVDTHARNHVYALIDATDGALIDAQSFPTTPTGINRAIAWVGRRTSGDADTLWVIEGVATYGAILASSAAAQGFPVAEAPRMDKKAHHGVGKSDVLDSHRIALAALRLPTQHLRLPRLNDGVRQGLRILVTARESMVNTRTRAINALNALARSNDLGINARYRLTDAQIQQISRWRTRAENLAIGIARSEARRLAALILDLSQQLKTNEQELTHLVKISKAAPLLDEPGFGVIAAAKCLVAWSHHGRVRNEAAFAALAGVNPIPASSGNTTRHRLNRGGDRRLNSALHMAAITRMTHDPRTRTYVEKRRAEGKTNREIRRCLKRYIARTVYRILNTSATEKTAALAA